MDLKQQVKQERLRKRMASGKMPPEERFIRTGETALGFSSVKAVKHIDRFLTFNWRNMETKALYERIMKLPAQLMVKINIKQMTAQERIGGQFSDDSINAIRTTYIPIVDVLLGYPKNTEEIVNKLMEKTFAMTLANIIYTYDIKSTRKRALLFYDQLKINPLRRYMAMTDSGGSGIYINPYFANDVRTPSYLAVRMLGAWDFVKEAVTLARIIEAHRTFRISGKYERFREIVNIVPPPTIWDIVQMKDNMENNGRGVDELGWMIGRSIWEYERVVENPKIGERLVYLIGQGSDVLPSEVQLTKALENTDHKAWTKRLKERYDTFAVDRCYNSNYSNIHFFDTLETSWYAMTWTDD